MTWQALVGMSALAGQALVGATTAESRRQSLVGMTGAATGQTLVGVPLFADFKPT
jgi:hypothetical protein